MQNKYLISIVVPFINEEKNIRQAVLEIIKTFQILSISGEIIAVDDGSNDNSAEIIKDLMHQFSCLKLVTHSVNKGLGAAYWSGVQAATGNLVTWMPADGETNCYEALRYLSCANHVDIIIPYVINKSVRGWLRNIISYFFTTIINFLFHLNLTYYNGAVIYRRVILNDMKLYSKGFFFSAELLIKCVKKNYLYIEVPYLLNQRLSGSSKALRLKSIFAVLCDLTLHFVRHSQSFFDKSPETAYHSKTYARLNNLEQETGVLSKKSLV